ncbi:hypothetical protein AS189_04015 [Arthrobacter alpinus]|uniref:Uncharacterized protein n=1 Tax=Arthrobacter alpinus TaxID=656366 RepID=A0A0S2LWV7_9MICC|nr:hypothetical protein AS189_04015 [Arthrobacter alpinus]
MVSDDVVQMHRRFETAQQGNSQVLRSRSEFGVGGDLVVEGAQDFCDGLLLFEFWKLDGDATK